MNNQVRFALSLGFLSPKHIRVHRFTGREAVSALYAFDLEITAGLTPAVFERAVLARNGRFAMCIAGKFRCIHGMVVRVDMLHAVPDANELYRYRLRLVPRAWQLKQSKRSRIFQNMRVDQVIDAVASELGVATRWRLKDDLPARSYVTQYEESDWSFLRRLCAENGVLFYFEQPPTFLDEALLMAIDEADRLPIPFPLGEVASLLANEILPAQKETLVFMDEANYAPMRVGSLASGDSLGNIAATALDAARALGAPTEFGIDLGPVHLDIGASSPTLHYRDSGGLVGSTEDWVSEAEFARAIRPTGAHYREYDPARPLTMIDEHAHISPRRGGLSSLSSLSAGVSLGSLAELAQGNVGGLLGDLTEGLSDAADGLIEPEGLEKYEHHGTDLSPHHGRRSTEPERMLRAHRRQARVMRGQSLCMRIEAGHRFKLDGHSLDELNQDWAVIEVRHEGTQNFHDAATGTPYRNHFRAVPRRVVFVPKRPERRSIQVCLTATVVGPANEEIHVNERGEIKVKFHWDRATDRHDSSCWIRTMHPWAGAGWGFQFIPRIGMEAVVAFEGGDPDKPLVTGCVYNGVLPPPFALPADKTISGIRTRSTPHAEGHNELSFQDAAGRERVYVHAQRDCDSVIERNRTATIHHDDATLVDAAQTLTVRGTQTNEVVGDRTSTMRHDDHLRVEGSRHVSVRQNLDEVVYGNRSIHVHERDRREVTGQAEDHVHGDLITRVDGNATMLVGKHDALRSATLVVEGPMQVQAEKVLDLVSEKEIILRCGRSFIRLLPGQIEISSPIVKVRGKKSALVLAKGNAQLQADELAGMFSNDKVMLASVDGGGTLLVQSDVEINGSNILLNSPQLSTINFTHHTPEPTIVELKDQEGQPIPYQRFRIICDDGSEYMGFVDEDGTAEADIESSGRILFPDLGDVEGG